MNLKALFIFLTVFFCSCTNSAISQVNQIKDFESCVAAGNKVLRMYPPKCVAPGVGIFTKEVKDDSLIKKDSVVENDSNFTPPPSQPSSFCKDTCGDGQCAEIVCQAEGCPCAETSDSCPQDCKP